MSILIEDKDDVNEPANLECTSANRPEGRNRSILKLRIPQQTTSFASEGAVAKRKRKRVSFADKKFGKLETILNPSQLKKFKSEKGKKASKFKNSNKNIKTCSCSIF